jgi:ABC-type transport system involved in multi-copper enzyme maturation permease subunit
MTFAVVWGNQFQSAMGTILIGGQVAIGFLFLSVAASTSLAEERARGSLDVLLTTPMSTLAIVWGKWRGTFRGTILLSVLPGLLGSLIALRHGHGLGVVLVVGLILTYGAALTSLGLAIATWVPRLGRAIALSVTAHILVTVGWLFLTMMLANRMSGVMAPGLASASPFIGTIFPLIEMQESHGPDWPECVGWMVFWISAYATLALVLFFWTVAVFDRCLERVSERPYGRPIPRRHGKPKPIAVPAEMAAGVEA